MLEKKGVGDTFFVSGTTGTAHSVDVVFFIFRTIKVDDCFDGGNVKTSTCHIGCYQNVVDTLLEFREDFRPFQLGLVSMDRSKAF